MICRWRCCSKNTSLAIYVGAVGLFTVCNLMGMMLIQKHSNGQSKIIIDKQVGQLPSKQEDQLKTTKAAPIIKKLSIDQLLQTTNFTFNFSEFRLDTKGVYKIHDFVVKGNGLDPYTRGGLVSLATQSSVDRLHWLLEVAQSWRAPLSISVFVPGIDFLIAKVYISYLRLCSEVIRENASFHFLYHRDMPPLQKTPYPTQSVPNCDRIPEVLPLLLRQRTSSFRKWWQQALYPQNHLRNIAREGCRTQYHFLTDVDIIPVPGMASHLNDFLDKPSRKQCVKCAYVVPTYEIMEKFPVPRTKQELLQRVKKKECRPFHAKVFIHNQFATNHSLWEKIPGKRPTEAAYRVTNYEFFYEPFYVATADVPRHDERFIGYGFTRNTQVFEMHLDGYQFWVLNPCFAVHKGMQSRRARGAWRERQNMMNRKHFIRFKHEMAQKYKGSPVPKLKS